MPDEAMTVVDSAPAKTPPKWDKLRIVMWSLCGAVVLLAYWRFAVLVMYFKEENARLHQELAESERARAVADGRRIAAQNELIRKELKFEARVKELSTEHNLTPSQVILQWLLERNLIVIPRSTTRGHIEENYAAFQAWLAGGSISAGDL